MVTLFTPIEDLVRSESGNFVVMCHDKEEGEELCNSGPKGSICVIIREALRVHLAINLKLSRNFLIKNTILLLKNHIDRNPLDIISSKQEVTVSVQKCSDLKLNDV